MDRCSKLALPENLSCLGLRMLSLGRLSGYPILEANAPKKGTSFVAILTGWEDRPETLQRKLLHMFSGWTKI